MGAETGTGEGWLAEAEREVDPESLRKRGVGLVSECGGQCRLGLGVACPSFGEAGGDGVERDESSLELSRLV